ncbi:hypothetical protein E3O06_11765 [Cryobacterium glaciale]|uniref:Uncharacterized protein n=1 Tax=Cryobacterium glaciale TaxID=1259145 RepID=A0A4R8UVX8_9MICO|nr:hypothetical protein [Cryobacterium glaciale]TFB71516.1 hypothetical protein E3O06_11765 [Cryobacterium glaciale]
MTDLPTLWTHVGLEAAGFEGFVPFTELQVTKPPKLPGIYVVLRPSTAPPSYLERSVAGWFKGNDPTAEQDLLEMTWVMGSTILYIGKANWGTHEDGLRRRLSQYRRFGAGKAVGHRGGEHIWQLADHAELLVCWKVTDDEEVKNLESRLIDDFEARHGRWPFANRKPEPIH